MQIRTLFAGFLAATLMVGLPTFDLAQAADAPAKAKKPSKKAAKPAPAASAAPASPKAAAAPAAGGGAGCGPRCCQGAGPRQAPAPAASSAGAGAVAGAVSPGPSVPRRSVPWSPRRRVVPPAGQIRRRLDKAVADAQAARKKAASVGGEWRDTGQDDQGRRGGR